MNVYLNTLIDNLLNNSEFPLVPYDPNPDPELLISFNFFKNLSGNIIFAELVKYIDHKNIKSALSTLLHHKEKSKYFNKNLSFEHFEILKPYLDEASIKEFNNIFYEYYGKRVLSGMHTSIDSDILDIISKKDIILYIDISLKLNLDNIHTVFSLDKSKIFYWLNNHKDMYGQLKKLNQAQFIFNNMNGKLNINDDSLRYFFEICPIDIPIYKDLKKSISLETIWKHTKNRLSVEFLFEIAETLDEIIFILSLPNIPMSILEKFLKSLKSEFPHIYDNFNSLVVMKKISHNKSTLSKKK